MVDSAATMARRAVGGGSVPKGRVQSIAQIALYLNDFSWIPSSCHGYCKTQKIVKVSSSTFPGDKGAMGWNFLPVGQCSRRHTKGFPMRPGPSRRRRGRPRRIGCRPRRPPQTVNRHARIGRRPAGWRPRRARNSSGRICFGSQVLPSAPCPAAVKRRGCLLSDRRSGPLLRKARPVRARKLWPETRVPAAESMPRRRKRNRASCWNGAGDCL